MHKLASRLKSYQPPGKVSRKDRSRAGLTNRGDGGGKEGSGCRVLACVGALGKERKNEGVL